MVLSLHVQGTSGLLQCSSASMDESSGRGVNKPTPQEDAARRLNTETTINGTFLVHPTGGFKAALVEAGKGYKESQMGGKSRQTGAARHITRSFLIERDQTPLLDPDTMKPLAVEWQDPENPGKPFTVRIDRRMGVLATVRAKPAIMVARPLIPRWAAIVDFGLPSDDFFGPMFFRVLTSEVVRVAGSNIGVGSFRPEKGGPFGRFELVNWALDGKWQSEAAEKRNGKALVHA